MSEQTLASARSAGNRLHLRLQASLVPSQNLGSMSRNLNLTYRHPNDEHFIDHNHELEILWLLKVSNVFLLDSLGPCRKRHQKNQTISKPANVPLRAWMALQFLPLICRENATSQHVQLIQHGSAKEALQAAATPSSHL